MDGRTRPHAPVCGGDRLGRLGCEPRCCTCARAVPRQTSNDLAFEPVRVLPLSWLWNTSFLARNAVMPLQDAWRCAACALELGLKYPSAVRLDANGELPLA